MLVLLGFNLFFSVLSLEYYRWDTFHLLAYKISLKSISYSINVDKLY